MTLHTVIVYGVAWSVACWIVWKAFCGGTDASQREKP